MWLAAICAAALLFCLWAADAKNRAFKDLPVVSNTCTSTDAPPVFTVISDSDPDKNEASSTDSEDSPAALPAHVSLNPFTIDRPVALPLEHATITSSFGFRDHPINGEYRFHSGLDLAAPEGSPIYSMLDGTVIKAEFASDYGNYVIIDHGNFQTLYAHCLTLGVQQGQTVSKGQQIARVGATGSATGNHLHVEFRCNGQRYDPAEILGQSYS